MKRNGCLNMIFITSRIRTTTRAAQSIEVCDEFRAVGAVDLQRRLPDTDRL
jgi:hypothetical protein